MNMRNPLLKTTESSPYIGNSEWPELQANATQRIVQPARVHSVCLVKLP